MLTFLFVVVGKMSAVYLVKEDGWHIMAADDVKDLHDRFSGTSATAGAGAGAGAGGGAGAGASA